MNIQDAQRIIDVLKSTESRYVFYQNDEDIQENMLHITRRDNKASLTIDLNDYEKYNSVGELDINKTGKFTLKMMNKAFKNMPSCNLFFGQEYNIERSLIISIFIIIIMQISLTIIVGGLQ